MGALHASQSKDPQPWRRDKEGKTILGLVPKEAHVSKLMYQSLKLPLCFAPFHI